MERIRLLQKNYRKMFFVQAFLNVKSINLVATLFYIQRGLTLSQIFYLAIVWSVTSIVFEIPSSYLADRWGRKKTIILASVLYTASGLVMLFAHSFAAFTIQLFLYALSHACLSGTDDALIYDTSRELGTESETLKQLGYYYSAERVFKIAAPLIAALVAAGLEPWQFLVLIAIDTVCSLAAVGAATTIVEPYHYMDVEKSEAGVLVDAWRLIRYDWNLTKAMLAKSILFIASFLIWRIHQPFFISSGVSVVGLGIGWSLFNVVGFFASKNITRLGGGRSVATQLNVCALVFVLFLSIFILLVAAKVAGPYILLAVYLAAATAEDIRDPLFSEFFNKTSLSFNRATTLSLTNFIKSILDVPLLFIGALLVAEQIIYPFIFSLILGVLVILFLRIKSPVLRAI